MRPIVRSIALLSAVALSTTALAVDDTVSRERHMVVLRAGTSPTEGEAVRERLVRSYGLKAPGTFSRGVLVGILVTGDPDSIARLKDEASIESVQKLGDPGSPPPGEENGKFLRQAPGWAVPGQYSVMLATEGLVVDFTRRVRTPGTYDPDFRAKDEAKRSAVLEVANALLAAHGGRLLSTFAPSSAGFTAAMTEPQARALARDPRVRSVAEATFTLLD